MPFSDGPSLGISGAPIPKIAYIGMGIEALCAAPPEAPSLLVGPVEEVGVGHLRLAPTARTAWNTARETLGVLETWAPATAMLPLPLALSELSLCRIVAHIVAVRPTAALTVQHLPCGLGASDLWLVSAPSLIVRIHAQRLRLPRSSPHRVARRGAHAFAISKPAGLKGVKFVRRGLSDPQTGRARRRA